MSNQSAIKGAASVSKREKSIVEAVVKKSYKWTTSPERCLLYSMIRLKPCGINKHLNVFLIREKMVEELKVHISTKCIWKYLNSKWDIQKADEIEGECFKVKKQPFTLPPEYNQLIAQQREKINKKNFEKGRLNGDNNKKKVFVRAGKTRCKSNSMSSVDSKEGLNEISSSMLSESTSVKKSGVGSGGAPTKIRRSLRTYDKLEDKDLDDSSNKKKKLRAIIKSDELNKSKDSKVLNVRSAKRKNRNVSESSISSVNRKQLTSSKSNLADLIVSDSSSRSLTPELLRGKTSIRSVTPESISRKSNLRSGDKEQKKTKRAIEMAYIRAGFPAVKEYLPIDQPKVIIKRLKPGKDFHCLGTGLKSKHFIQNKNEANNKVKSKTRGRVTSDTLVVQQSPDVPLGRRSCSNKNT